MDDHISKPIKQNILLDFLSKQGAKPTAPQPAQVRIIDNFDYAAAISRSDPEIVEIIASVFRKSVPRELKQLREALSTFNMNDSERIAHSLKASLLTVNADPAAHLAREIEQLCQISKSETCLALLDLLEGEVNKLLLCFPKPQD